MKLMFSLSERHARWLAPTVRRPFQVALLMAVSAAVISAPNPSSGTVSEADPDVEYDGGPLLAADPTATTTNQCPNSGQTVEVFPLQTVGLSAEFASTHALKVDLAPVASADTVLTLRTGTGAHLGSSDNSPNSAEQVSVLAQPGTTSYRVVVCLFAGSATSYHVRAELVEANSGGGDPGPCDATIFGTADPVCPGVPRFQTFVPEALGATWANDTSGEFNMGFNPRTGRIMAKNSFPNARITPAEIKPDGTNTSSGLPESCPELWEDKSVPSEVVGLDPILWTDQPSGRSFMSNSTAGAVGEFAFTDNDGDLWVPASASPPNGGVDHQTIGSGPIPESLADLRTDQNFGQYVVYCSQDLVGANCQRSLTLGTSFESTAVPALGPGTNNSQSCGGLHGHLRAAPDGTMYIPDKSCGTKQGGSFTTDTSTTPWTEFSIPNSAAGGADNSDPSIALDANNTVYFCYMNSEAGGTELHPRVAVGKRNGSTITWLRDVDIGKSHGVKNGVFAQAWGGSAGRAACGFIGTNVGGSFQNAFNGKWYAFISTTYDEGRTWQTVNVSPDDPVQNKAGICLGGTSCGSAGHTAPRNLLDFNEIVVDDKGRSIMGFSDGCVSAGCVAGTSGNNNQAWMKVVRQIGGRTLLASQDSVSDLNNGIDPTTGPINPVIVNPRRACLLDKNLNHPGFSTRDADAAHLKWRTPDAGGSTILNYDIYRSTTSTGPYTLIGSTPDAKTLYDDATSGDVPELFYVVKANTAAGKASAYSNEIRLTIGGGGGAGELLCVVPGLTKATDAIDDTNSGCTTLVGPAPPGSDLLRLQIAQPFWADGVARVVFTLTTTNGQSPQPAGAIWYVSMKIGSSYKGVRMSWNGPNPTFESYTPAPDSEGNVDGVFVTPGTLKPAEVGSSYVAPFNKIVIIVKASDLGFSEGTVINGFTAGVWQSVATPAGSVACPHDAMPNGFAYDGGHVAVSNQFCRPNSEPIVDTFTAAPPNGPSPLTVTFNASAHDPDTAPAPADTIARYVLDFGDGTPPYDSATPPTNLAHVYQTDESSREFEAKLDVYDSRGLKNITGGGKRVTAFNVLVPRLTAPATAAKGEIVTLDGSESSAPEGQAIVEYQFDLDDGTPVQISPTSSIDHVYTVSGAKEASLTIRSSNGELSTTAATAIIDVINRAPTAAIDADTTEGFAPLTVTFDGSGSSDPDTTDYISMYDLDFGDGPALHSQVTPFTPKQHTYTQPGYYNVLLRVYDNELLKSDSDALIQIAVPNQPPVAALSATPSTQGKNRAVTFSAAGSSDAEGPLLYAFDFGDGVTQSGTASSVTHAYAQAGVYTATVTVTDSSLDARSASQAVTITNAAPVAVLSTTSAKVAPLADVRLSGVSSSDADVGDAVQSYTFTFGDGSPAVTQAHASVVHHYAHAGTYVASLVVTDKDGVASDRTELPIEVSVGDNTEMSAGALAPWMLAVLGALGLWRRRRYGSGSR